MSSKQYMAAMTYRQWANREPDDRPGTARAGSIVRAILPVCQSRSTFGVPAAMDRLIDSLFLTTNEMDYLRGRLHHFEHNNYRQHSFDHAKLEDEVYYRTIMALSEIVDLRQRKLAEEECLKVTARRLAEAQAKEAEKSVPVGKTFMKVTHAISGHDSR